ncbi:MAG: hypothetical protein K8S99_00695 [Planctomycetes bacterium]|nr:hypothetical protein [Planctomycetota bacterium]
MPHDPGARWVKQAGAVIDAVPDGVTEPLPEARWPSDAKRTGVYGVVSPRVVRLRSGGYRLYYTQIMPRPGFPAGANDYENATTRILSAVSADGLAWTPEPGVRLSAVQGGAGEFRVASSEVVPALENPARLRMYYECCPGSQSVRNSIRSAVSDDGLTWNVEPGERFARDGTNHMSARILFLDDRRCRLYCCRRGVGIVSAISDDGVTFREEPGVRIADGGTHDRVVAFACDILKIAGGGYVMYYAGYAAPNRAYILRAESEDGLAWRKAETPVVSPSGPGSGAIDAVKCSEVSLFRLPGAGGKPGTFRMVYEACDGTAVGERGVWRIAGAGV